MKADKDNCAFKLAVAVQRHEWTYTVACFIVFTLIFLAESLKQLVPESLSYT